MHKVIHLLPYDGIGGAEEAARSMSGASSPGIDFRVRYVFPRAATGGRRATFNPWALLQAARTVRREAPDLLIVSLWRACLVGILVRLLRPRTRMVVLIHNSVDAHAADRPATRAAMALSEAVWADSEASIRLRFRKPPRAPVTQIPFLTRRLDPIVPDAASASPAPAFIFWGRLAPQKDLPTALRLFHRIRQRHPRATFTVIGPDSGQRAALESLCADLGLSAAVRFEGPQPFAEILRRVPGHAFYLQTSRYEGMAMSVVEAMQLGLVPVVTPVGEVSAYCRAGHNAVIVREPEAAAAEVLQLLDDAPAYRRLRDHAIATWQAKPLYRDAVILQCERLVGVEPFRPGPPRDVD
ncbi:glycosyltransferase family 4 protein [Ramlibacter terrae]|uniref:Glycosyltransferase family 4 protein n=1 Tax=Ramlibacter terrae TaxID=2732511 RepID=A0ABX6P200_9BURK|nr:glycosyltransferase family 4 protein [Ramlibacter terrae]